LFFTMADDNDWVFDYVMEVFKSPAWETPILSFIDEHCIFFDSEEENKLSHSEVHNQFRDIVERLLVQQLAEIGISAEDFAKACEVAIAGQRDAHKVVLDQIFACDDFRVFKKLMVKRNIQLELEAMDELKKSNAQFTANEDPAEAERVFKAELQIQAQGGAGMEEEGKESEDIVDTEGLTPAQADLELKTAIDANLRELELVQKQEEMEQKELEQAINASVALEEKRMQLVKMEAKQARTAETAQQEPSPRAYTAAESKGESSSNTTSSKSVEKQSGDSKEVALVGEEAAAAKQTTPAAAAPKAAAKKAPAGPGADEPAAAKVLDPINRARGKLPSLDPINQPLDVTKLQMQIKRKEEEAEVRRGEAM
jgi:hypothetical protein